MAEHRMEIGLKDQMEIATDAIRAAALELLQTGQANPHVWPWRGSRLSWAPVRRGPAGCP